MLITLEQHIDKNLKNHEIIISFSGNLDVNVLNSALIVVEKKLNERNEKLRYTKKIYNVLVEVLQNIFHHGVKNAYNETFSIFSVSLYNNVYFIYCGNYIEDKLEPLLANKISAVNLMNADEVVEQYRKVLNNGIVSAKGGSGLGFLDMKRKTKNNIHFSFFPDSKHTFFLIELNINTK